MTDNHQDQRAAAPEPLDDTASDSELQSFGISSRQHTSYEWNGYRYSNASDAIAAAKRATR